VIRV
jgi:hypothetical protein